MHSLISGSLIVQLRLNIFLRALTGAAATRLCTLLFAIMLALLYVHAVQAATRPPALAGWTHPSNGRERDGIILSGRDVIYSAPVIAEIDGNTANGREVAAAGADGIVYVYRADGSLLWSASTPITSCTGTTSRNKLLSSPAVGSLRGDGVINVVVGFGGITKNCDGGVIAFNGASGAKVWTFSTSAFARREGFSAFLHSVISTPALADTDGDGTLEVGFGSFDRNVYLLNSNGRVRWYYNAADTVWSSATFANVDSDPALEMIIGTDITANSRLNPPTYNGGYVYAFDTQRRLRKKLGFRQAGAYKWQRYLDQVIFSAPVVADVIPDSPGEEIIVGSGCFFPERSALKSGRWVKVLRPSDGKVLRTLEAPACLASSPAVADLDGDGALDVVATVNGSTSVGGDGSGRLVAWDPASGAQRWSTVVQHGGRSDPFLGHLTHPIAADLDGNGSIEVIVPALNSVGIFAATDGTPLTCQESSCGSDELDLTVARPLRGALAVGDVNQDGILDLIAAGGTNAFDGRAILYGWSHFASLTASQPGTALPYAAPWPLYRGSPTRDGRALQTP